MWSQGLLYCVLVCVCDLLDESSIAVCGCVLVSWLLSVWTRSLPAALSEARARCLLPVCVPAVPAVPFLFNNCNEVLRRCQWASELCTVPSQHNTSSHTHTHTGVVHAMTCKYTNYFHTNGSSLSSLTVGSINSMEGSTLVGSHEDGRMQRSVLTKIAKQEHTHTLQFSCCLTWV